MDSLQFADYKIKFIYFIILFAVIENFIILWTYRNEFPSISGCSTEALTHVGIKESNIIIREGPYHLYILIVSAPSNYAQRRAIRNTWGNTVQSYNFMKYTFVVGNIGVSQSDMIAIQKERDNFGDIIVLDGVEEVYTKLSRKVLKAFTWASKHIDAVYYLKTDDDSYVVIDNLYKVLTEEKLSSNRLLLGNIYKQAEVHKLGKWAEFGWFLCRVYLSFPTGVGYILTQDVVQYLEVNSERLMHYNNEDTSLGSWVAALKLEYVHDGRILPVGNNCKSSNWLLHYISPAMLIKIHSSWLNAKRTCS